MPTSNSGFITLCYDNYPDQREFVFSMKGRPFSMLSSQKLPVPTTSLIDFNLVNDLGLKMMDLQCSKFTYGGHRFRILGKISQTVQTITDGVISGTVHIRASVVEGLRSVFDSHSIAGKKVSEMLSKKISPDSNPEASSPPSTPSPAKSSKTPSTPKVASPAVKVITPPPGFPPQPLSFSPKPFNGHYSNTYSQPQLKDDLLPARTLSLKPDDGQHHYGRVVMAATSKSCGPGMVHVDYMDGEHQLREVFIEGHTVCQNLQPGDAVLLRRVEKSPDKRAPIYMLDRRTLEVWMIYTSREEAQLRTLGEVFPDVSPDHHPGGYHG